MITRTSPMTEYLVGQQFGRWRVLSFAGKDMRSKTLWLCECGCGRKKAVESHNLKAGRSLSCRPCSAKVVGAGRITHGESGTVVYRRWAAMKQSCFNPKARDYEFCGGLGATVCPEWVVDFVAFRDHLGAMPTDMHVVDRIDPGRGFVPGNVRWVTQAEQMDNRRRFMAAARGGKL